MLDPITLEVVRNRLQYLTQEMSAAIVKTAVSPVVSEARDFSCMLYDVDGHIVATAATVPFHFGVSADAIAVVRERFAGRIAPGDVFLANDPHDGGGLHLQDVVVMRPIFRRRTRIGWASTSGHMIDMGGLVPGSFAPNARECYQEGVRVPPTRILRAGEPVEDVWNLILNNVRQRETVEMDLRSLVAGTHVAAEKVCELEAEVGPPAFRQALREIRGLSARVVRRRIRELPTGEYVEQGWAEFDDEAFLVRCRLRVRDGMLEFDYTGSSPQCPYFFNSKPHIVRSELVVRLHQLLAADVPFTDGVLAPVRVVAPEGSIVNALPPAPVAAAHMHVALLAMELGETCLKKALACALPRNGLAARQARITAPGGTTGMGLSSWHGRTRDGTAETFLVMDGNAVGAGACSDRDGIDMTGSDYGGPGLVYPDVETVEQTYPVLYLYKRLRPDAGGAGRFRGGASVDAAFVLHGTDGLEGTTLGMRKAVPLPGLFGGYPGACTLFELRQDTTLGERLLAGEGLPTEWSEIDGRAVGVGLNAAGIRLRPGEVFRFANASGSGFGDPLERDPDRVLGDLRDGYVTPATARSVYGLVVTDGGRAVDVAPTATARDAIRAARRARARFPERAPDPPRPAKPIGRLSLSVEVVRVGEKLVARCAGCGAGLALAPAGWRAGVARGTLGTAEYAERAGVWAPFRAAGAVVLCEYVCPGCGRLLATEVGLDGAAHEDDVRPDFYVGASSRDLPAGRGPW
jgi:N-methylhydantoinase B